MASLAETMERSGPAASPPEPGAVAGVHVEPAIDPDGDRLSVVATVDRSGRLVSIETGVTDPDLAALTPADVRLIAVDIPLRVPNDRGRRDIERMLAWCDVPAFPASRQRLGQLHGGLRGPGVEEALSGRGPVVESFPDLLLRQLVWERHPRRATIADLGDYRAAFAAARPPRYRPKARGRATPSGLVHAASLLGDSIDLGGWRPAADPDDWQAIRDAARLDALALAATADRAIRRGPAHSLVLESAAEGPYLLPADALFRERAALNLARLRRADAVSLREAPLPHERF